MSHGRSAGNQEFVGSSLLARIDPRVNDPTFSNLNVSRVRHCTNPIPPCVLNDLLCLTKGPLVAFACGYCLSGVCNVFVFLPVAWPTPVGLLTTQLSEMGWASSFPKLVLQSSGALCSREARARATVVLMLSLWSGEIGLEFLLRLSANS